MELTAQNINDIISSGKAFAILRMPGEDHLIVKAGNWERKKITELKEECFFIQPFDSEEKGYALFPMAKEEKSKKKIKVPKPTTKEEYASIFETFQKEIQKGKISKLVLSRVKKDTNQPINIGESFFSLCSSFPLAAVNLFFIPDVGLWMGASPETLLKIEKDKVATMSLAGTTMTGEKKWTDKEKKEQQIVTDFISEAFNHSNKLEKFEEILQAGNVQHLCTVFELPLDELPTDWKKLVNILHPTPAVGGYPTKVAAKIIDKLETHSREFYAGYFGVVQPKEGCHLFVNIRCMKLIDHVPYLFTGGGITAESDAEKEWEETEVKAIGIFNSLCIGEK